MKASPSTVGSRLTALVVGGVLLIAPVRHAAADPLLMFLLGFAQNLLTSSLQERRPVDTTPAPPAPMPKSPANMDAADLRAVVDESFGYLSRAQRAELLAGLDRALSDPANAPYKQAILAQFIGVARQVQHTHTQLDRLSAEQKRAVAVRFGDNYRSLPADRQRELAAQLHARALPVPADLAELMLAELNAPR